MTKHNALALFDFDGTISTQDSLADFIQFAVGKPRYYAGLARLSPLLTAYVLKLVPNDVAKQKLLGHFFQGWEWERFQQVAQRYSLTALPHIVRPQALQRLRWHQDQGHTVVVVSASMECWLRPWCEQEQLALLGTRLEQVQGRLTGRFASPNCYGEEKVCRIQAHYCLQDYEAIYAYGDSNGDKAMLQLATQPFYKPFRD